MKTTERSFPNGGGGTDHLSVNDSSTYLINGEMKNSITLLSPVLISAVTAIPGEMGISLSLTRIVKRLGFNLIL